AEQQPLTPARLTRKTGCTNQVMFDLIDQSRQRQRVSCLSVSVVLHATLIGLLLISTLSSKYRFTFLPIVHAGNTEAVTRTVRAPLFLPVAGPPNISAVEPVVSPVAATETSDTSDAPKTSAVPAGPALLAVPAGMVIPENDAPVSFTYTPR